MRIIAYLRVSTDMQDHGIDGQRLACKDFVEKIGAYIEKEFVDVNYSGTLPYIKRPALGEALDFLKKGDMLLVYKRDRLARGLDTMKPIQDLVNEKKAVIVSTCGEGTEQNNAQTRLYRNIADSFALYEKEITCERISLAMTAMKHEGKLVGRVPFGLSLKDDGVYLERCKEEQAVIDEMLRLRKEGYTIRELTQLLNSKGYFNRGETPWTKSSLHRILSRGQVQVGQTIIN